MCVCVRACVCARVYVWTFIEGVIREREGERERERENLRALIERVIVQMPHVLGTLSRFRVQGSDVSGSGWMVHWATGDQT